MKLSPLEKLQESFIIKQLIQLEKDLVKKVDKPYKETNKIIEKKIRDTFAKYDNYPQEFKYLLIKKDLEKQRVFQQISRRYQTIGKDFSSFLKQSLVENHKEAVKHSVYTVKSVQEGAKKFEPTYQETNDVESDWRRRTSKHSKQINTIITQGIAKHHSADMIAEKLVEETGIQIYEAKRLARTETARVLNETSLKVFKGMGVKLVRWLDSTEQIFVKNKKGKGKTRVCKYCRKYASGGRNGVGVYPINQLPSPCPAHPNCRCTLAPVLETKK